MKSQYALSRRPTWMNRLCVAGAVLLGFMLAVAQLFLHALPVGAELTQAWDRTFATGDETMPMLWAVAWDETASELAVLISAKNVGTSGYTIWRIDATGERVGERPIPEALRDTSLRGLVIEAGGLTLVSLSDRMELATFGRGGELKSQRALPRDVGYLEPIDTLRLADGTIVLGGALDEAAVAMIRPDRTTPSVTTIPTEGFGIVLDVAPARGGKVLALVHGREEDEAMYVFARGEIHVVLLNRDGGVVQDVRLEGRLGSLLDTGKGYAVLLDLGGRQEQDWWLLRFNDDLREVARLRVMKTESEMPRLSQLLPWPGSGFVGVLGGSREQPCVARFSRRGTIRSLYEIPEPKLGWRTLSTIGGNALYVVASSFEDEGDKFRDVVRIFKFVDK